MKSAQTNSLRGSNRTDAARILGDVSGATPLVGRIDLISKRLIGRPYVESPLGGGPALSEKLTASIDGFDCVTYIETVLALALSYTVEEFLGALREMRYEKGDV